MEIFVLAIVLCATLFFATRYVKQTFKKGELCQRCHEGKAAGKKKVICGK